MTRRPFLAALTGALLVLCAAAPGATAISVDCTPAPADPVAPWLTTVAGAGYTKPSTAPPIAVLDTGISSVPELNGRIRPGYDVAGGDSSTNDIDGHGTAVAAIAAAAAGRVEGVSPTSSVIPIKIFDDAGNSSPEALVAAIERAVNARAAVINISAAGPAVAVDNASRRNIQDAIDAAVSLGIPVVASSGNEGAGQLDFPATLAHVIAVGATDENGGAATFSNTGSGLDLVAPGSNIVTAAPSTLCSSGYAVATGTSFSTPMVSATVALLVRSHPDIDVGQITDMLRLRGARSTPPSWTPELGFGMLNISDVLNAPVPTPDQSEVNDDIHWAKLQGMVFAASARKKTLWARMAPHTDPSDVYQVKLNKRERFRVTLKAPPGAAVALSFGSKKLRTKRGTSFTEQVAKSGIYYVGATLEKSPPAGSGYALTLSRSTLR